MLNPTPHSVRRLAAAATAAAVVLGTAGTVTASAKGPGTVYFGGFTSQDQPVVIRLTPDRRMIERAAVVLDSKCSDGETIYGIVAGDGKLHLKGAAFSDSFTVPPSPAGGKTVALNDHLHMTFNKSRSRLTGSWQEVAAVTDQATGTTVTCDSGVVSFTAVD